VKVEFASLNPLIPKIQRVNFDHFPMPLTRRFDFSGTVVAVGSKDSNQSASFAINDRVIGFSNKASCFAEYVKVNQATVSKQGFQSISQCRSQQREMAETRLLGSIQRG